MNAAGKDIIVSMQGVDKWFGKFQALKNVNLEVRSGERIVVCGPSGSGKSTLIRCINALEEYHWVIYGLHHAANLAISSFGQRNLQSLHIRYLILHFH
jgi:ABC-type polar amino acid transport system ATPase subunit